MCYPVTCTKCGKTTWAGCGKHKDMVMAKIPVEQRCKCPREGEIAPKPEEIKTNTTSSLYEIKTNDEFEELIKKNKVIVIDFFASWCTSCKELAPIFEKIAVKCSNEKLDIKFAKINGDEVSEVVDSQEIDSYPTFIAYKNGAIAIRKKGKIEEQGFYEEIKKLL